MAGCIHDMQSKLRAAWVHAWVHACSMMTDHDSEMRMVRQMCGLSMRENQLSTELGDENMCRQYETWRGGAGLGWHGRVEHTGDSDWVKPCSMLVVQTNKNCVCADMQLLGVDPRHVHGPRQMESNCTAF